MECGGRVCRPEPMGLGNVGTTLRLKGGLCYDKDLQTSFYLFKLGVLILESL